jgi:hypothetical protein
VTDVRIVVRTTQPTTLAISVGVEGEPVRVVRDGRRKVHRVTITGLAAATRYACSLRATPARGKARAQGCAFTTLPRPAKRFVSTSAQAELANATTTSQAGQVLNGFFGQYGMTFSTGGTPSSFAAMFATFSVLDDADLSNLKNFGRALIDEWAKYPVAWIRATRVVGVVVVKRLSVLGTARTAMPDHVADVVYYDVSMGSAGGLDAFVRGVVHHEFEHLATYNLSGSYSPPDPAWSALNPPGFQYGKGGASCYEPSNTCLQGEHPVPGFVTGYAASGIEEDKAEVYSYLLTRTYYERLKNWIRTDTHLAAKVTAYKNALCSRVVEMCGSYFDDINP